MAKGNADVRSVLLALHEGDKVSWNGINSILRSDYPGFTARVIHETMTRSDALIEATQCATPVSIDRALPLGAFAAESQFTSQIFSASADVVVLSIQADVMNGMARSRADGHLFYPYSAREWPAPDRQWLAENYHPTPSLDPVQSMANFGIIIERLRETGDRPILIFNLSPIIPWERLHCYRDMSETLSERIRRFNLALNDLSRRTGVSIVDVDALLARSGAERLKMDAVTLNADGCRLVAAEVVRILDDLGCFADLDVAA